MAMCGGLSAVTTGLLNETKNKRPIIVDSFFGSLITTTFEFIFGYILNIILELNVWDYLNLPFNLYGQVCLQFSLIWFFLMPFAIWLDDHLRHNWFGEESNSTLLIYYKRFVTFK